MGMPMNFSRSDVIPRAHAAFGVTGCMAVLWVFAETLNSLLSYTRFLDYCTGTDS